MFSIGMHRDLCDDRLTSGSHRLSPAFVIGTAYVIATIAVALGFATLNTGSSARTSRVDVSSGVTSAGQ